MERQSVSSSNLKSIGYENAILDIEFKNEDVYRFSNVPKDIYEALMNAESHGKYFNEHIRNKEIYDPKKIT